jgi:hypothetical protein
VTDYKPPDIGFFISWFSNPVLNELTVEYHLQAPFAILAKMKKIPNGGEKFPIFEPGF